MTEKYLKSKLKKLFKDKRVLILENDFTLSHQIKVFYKFLNECGIETNCIYDLKEVPLSYIKEQIAWFDVIVFQSQFVYENSYQIRDYCISMTNPKCFVECYAGDPNIEYNPSKIHTLYNFTCYINWYEIERIEFEKIK